MRSRHRHAARAGADRRRPARQICSLLVFPENAVYPPRDHVVDFRRQLGAKYQAMGRSAQSAVDPDGAAIWLGEYYRYRTSGCDHATATQKVMAQIDGQPAPATCAVACAYNLETPASLPGIGGNFTVQLLRTSGSCDWVALSDTPWITLNSPRAGTDRTLSSYTAAPNPGAPRTGSIRFIYAGGTSYLDVRQASPSYNLAFLLYDPAVSATAPTTECRIKTANTTCTLSAVTAQLPKPVVTTTGKSSTRTAAVRSKTQVGPLSTFSFTESCGTSAPEGSPVAIRVTLEGHRHGGQQCDDLFRRGHRSRRCSCARSTAREVMRHGAGDRDGYFFCRAPAIASAAPARTAAPPTIGGSGNVRSRSAVAWIGPMSTTVSRLVYVIP